MNIAVRKTDPRIDFVNSQADCQKLTLNGTIRVKQARMTSKFQIIFVSGICTEIAVKEN